MEAVFEKIENKINLKEVVKKIFIVFMILQPILDIYMSLFDEKVQILGVSLATILRFTLVGIMVVLIAIHARKNKSTKLLILYAILVFIYIIFHHINAKGFSVNLLEAKYNFLSEILYIARMCIPVCLIYVIYNIKLNYKDIKKIVLSVSLIISLVIIISNLFKIGYMSYAVEKNVVSDNMISWFSPSKDKSDWSTLTCRGLFQSGNQLSGVMIILVPILTYICVKERKIRNWLVLDLHIIGMINLTTRVGAVGGILMLICVIGLHVLEKIIHKDISIKDLKSKNLYCFLVSIILIGLVFYNSPFKVRSSESGFGADISANKQTANNVDSAVVGDEDINKVAYIEENVENANINGYFIYQAYPYTDDVDFWFDLIMNVPEYERSGNRKMRALLIDRILQRDNRISNYIWGISFTRSSSFVWPERDFETQFDALGIVGMLLFIFPYILIILMAVVKIIMKIKEYLYLNKVVYLISLCVGCLSAYLSGHILNEVFPFIFLSMCAGIVLNMIFGDNPEIYETKKDLRKYFDKLYCGGKEQFYADIKGTLLKEEKRFVVTANPETIMIAEKNEEFQKCLFKEYVTIVPDGVGIIKGAKMLGYPQRETITGIGLVEYLLTVCNENKKSIFLFGAKPEVVEKLNEVIKSNYPDIVVAGYENGYVENKQEVFEKIKKLSPDLILIALGIPNQELLIDENINDFQKGIFIGVGGSFDVLSGMKKRAPKIFIKLHLEWLYRIITEPKRIKRFIDSNVKYLFRLSEEK